MSRRSSRSRGQRRLPGAGGNAQRPGPEPVRALAVAGVGRKREADAVRHRRLFRAGHEGRRHGRAFALNRRWTSSCQTAEQGMLDRRIRQRRWIPSGPSRTRHPCGFAITNCWRQSISQAIRGSCSILPECCDFGHGRCARPTQPVLRSEVCPQRVSNARCDAGLPRSSEKGRRGPVGRPWAVRSRLRQQFSRHIATGGRWAGAEEGWHSPVALQVGWSGAWSGRLPEQGCDVPSIEH